MELCACLSIKRMRAGDTALGDGGGIPQLPGEERAPRCSEVAFVIGVTPRGLGGAGIGVVGVQWVSFAF